MNIAFDPGYGNTKLFLDGCPAVLPSAIVRPREIGLAGMGLKTHAAAHQVTIAGTRYVAGEGAWMLGDPIGSMDYTTLAGEARRGLFYAAFASLKPPGEYAANLVMGLPVPLMTMADEAQAVVAALRASYRTAHEWDTPSGRYCLTVSRFTTVAQPVGAYTDWLLDGELRQRKGAAKAEVAVVDIGMNTLDLFVVKEGQLVERYLGGGTVGVRRLLYRLDSDDHDLVELDAALREGSLRPTRAQLDDWLDEVLGLVERTFPKLARFAAVIPAGGGAVVLGDLLRMALIRKGARVAWPDDPILANARGLYKWLAAAAARRQS